MIVVGARMKSEKRDSDARKGENSITDPTLQAQIDAATAYEEFFVPALFQE